MRRPVELQPDELAAGTRHKVADPSFRPHYAFYLGYPNFM